MYCVFTLDSEPTWQTSILYIVLLIYVNETIYLYGNLPFFKIHANRFMAQDDSPGAILWVLRHFLSLLSRLLQSQTWLKWLSSSSSSSYITSSSRLAGGGPLSAPFWCLCQKLSLSLLYFNKTVLHKSSERSSLVSGPGLSSSPLEAKNSGSFVIQQQPFNYPRYKSKLQQLDPLRSGQRAEFTPGHTAQCHEKRSNSHSAQTCQWLLKAKPRMTACLTIEQEMSLRVKYCLLGGLVWA